MTVHARSLLVTGGAGFIGANYVQHRLRTHAADRVVVLDALTYAGNLRSLDSVATDQRFRFIRGDIGDIEAVVGALQHSAIDTLVHFAAETHVDRSIDAPDAFVSTNVVGTHTLLKASRAHWESLAGEARAAFRFHHVGTDEVYGSLGELDSSFTERTAFAPNSPYAATKASADHLVRAYHRTYGLPVTTTNCSNNYGPFQFPDKLIPSTLVRSLEGKPLPVYGDGQHRRDWLHVADHCNGIDLALDRGALGESYNIGGGVEMTNLDLVRALCASLDARFAASADLRGRFPDAPGARRARTEELITFVRDRPGHDRRYSIDWARAADELGYRPSVKFERGLDETVAWYLEHEDWWRPMLSSP